MLEKSTLMAGTVEQGQGSTQFADYRNQMGLAMSEINVTLGDTEAARTLFNF